MDEPLLAPLSVTLNVTEKCNLSCAYCFARTARHEAVHMPAEMVVDLVHDLNKRGVWRIVLGGGEPFLHPNMIEILTKILRRHIGIALITNGIPIENCFNELVKLGEEYPRFLKLQVSVDGPTVEIHNRHRKQGEKVFEIVRKLAAAGVDIQLATVVTKLNIESAHKIVDVFYPAIKQFHYMQLMPSRLLWENGLDLWPDPGKMQKLWEVLRKREKQLNGIHISIPDCGNNILAAKPTLDCPGCTAGFARMDINANGDVVACNMAYRSLLGNLYEKSLDDIWFSEEANRVRKVEIPLCRLPEYQVEIPEGELDTIP